MNPLHQQFLVAIMNNELSTVVECINKGIIIDSVYPLSICADSGFYEMTELLLDNGADINFSGSEAIKIAYSGGHFNIVNLLLERGIELEGEAESLSYYCLENDDAEYFEIFFEHGLKIDLKDFFRKCIVKKKINLIRMILNNFTKIKPKCIEMLQNYVTYILKPNEINTYRFVKMLISKEMIDIAD